MVRVIAADPVANPVRHRHASCGNRTSRFGAAEGLRRMRAMVLVDGFEVVVETFDFERERNSLPVGVVDRGRTQSGRVEIVGTPDHAGGDMLSLGRALKL